MSGTTKRRFHRYKKAALATVVALVVVAFSALLAVHLPNIPRGFWMDIGYPGIFLLSLASTGSVLIPIPYTVVLLAIAPAFDPLLLATAAGLGAGIGELAGYGLGYAGRQVIGKKRRHQLDAMLRIFGRFGLPIIFIFALTPLPDDLLFIPLGLMHYSLWKALAVCVAGKFTMSLLIAYAGKAVGELFVVDWMLAAAVAVLLALVVVAMFRIDWVRLAEKYAPSGKNNEERGG